MLMMQVYKSKKEFIACFARSYVADQSAPHFQLPRNVNASPHDKYSSRITSKRRLVLSHDASLD